MYIIVSISTVNIIILTTAIHLSPEHFNPPQGEVVDYINWHRVRDNELLSDSVLAYNGRDLYSLMSLGLLEELVICTPDYQAFSLCRSKMVASKLFGLVVVGVSRVFDLYMANIFFQQL